MTVYKVYGESKSTMFEDKVVAKDEEQLREVLTKRYGEVLTLDIMYSSLEKIRVKDLTAADLLRLLRK